MPTSTTSARPLRRPGVAIQSATPGGPGDDDPMRRFTARRLMIVVASAGLVVAGRAVRLENKEDLGDQWVLRLGMFVELAEDAT